MFAIVEKKSQEEIEQFPPKKVSTTLPRSLSGGAKSRPTQPFEGRRRFIN